MAAKSDPASATDFAAGGRLSRFSSRTDRLSHVYLANRLREAQSYDRIAGYFRSSIFELVGEEIEAVGRVRIVANSNLDPDDVDAAQKVREARLFQRFVEDDVIIDATLHRPRYAKLHALLTSGKVEIRIVPRTIAPFLHGKAGVIRGAECAVAFVGSINETRAAWAHNYELVWEDSSAEGVEWVQAEFDELWEKGKPLPDAIIAEVGRLADRQEVEVTVFHADPQGVAPAALIEAPIYRDGESLQPWQRAFVAQFVAHRDIYEKVRLLLADEVGVGKTLSLATAALVSVLLGDGNVLILVPSSLTEQWQVELLDRLGMPVARWHSLKKCWIDPAGRIIKSGGTADVARCPYAIGIVSTGLIVQGLDQHGLPKQGSEAGYLLNQRFGLVVLDEAHKARGSQPIGSSARTPNNLLQFVQKIASRTRHLLLSTATPIQTSELDLWDLLDALGENADFVIGTQFSPWRRPGAVLPYLKGERRIADLREGWQLLSNPLPPATNDLLADIRDALDLKATDWSTSKLASDITNPVVLAKAEMALTALREGHGYFQRENPLLRHIMLRKRRDLERLHLLPNLPVDIHPNPDLGAPNHLFEGLSLRTSDAFESAYAAVNRFTKAYAKRDKPAGFMKTLLLQRLCSSHAAGVSTARGLLGQIDLDDETQENLGTEALEIKAQERVHLRTIIEALTGAEDPKFRAVRYFLDEHRSSARSWLQMGCIIFSQYYDTANWIAQALSSSYPSEVIALYAGAGKSKLLVGGEATSVIRPQIKRLVAQRQVKLLVATDAASEGLNLQTLGTLVNVDLPWNPSRLEQRIGRIKRFGQTRERVDMANLTYSGTIDERVYRVLSERLKVSNDIFGTLPETIDADWIENLETLDERLRAYTTPRRRFDPFEQLSSAQVLDDQGRWTSVSAVLARSNIEEALSQGWADRRSARPRR